MNKATLINIKICSVMKTKVIIFSYVLVIFPTQRDRQKNLALLFFLLIWLISILLALPLFVASDLDRVFEDKNCGIVLTICHEKNLKWKQACLQLFLFVFFFFAAAAKKLFYSIFFSN